MSNFLYRMVQRAAGAPAVAPTPQPPRQFHWPAVVDLPSLRPNAFRAPSNPTLLQWGRADDAFSRLGQTNEQTNEGRVGPAFSEQDQTPGGPGNLRTSPVTNEMTFSQVTASQTTGPVEDNSTVASHQDQRTLAPIRGVITYRTRPGPRTQMTRDSQPPLPSATAPLPRQAPGSLQPSTTRSSSKADADSHAAAESLSTAIGRAINAINTEAINADAIETVPRPSRTVVPRRSDSPGSQQMPFAAPAQRFDARPSPPPVEVKIGSVEIVFDPPAAASQPAAVRPVGFAEFADLRRYATRPWPSRR